MIYLFMSAFEHNCKGAVTNQILPAELKLPDWLHDQQKENKHYTFKNMSFELKQRCPTTFLRPHEIPFHM